METANQLQQDRRFPKQIKIRHMYKIKSGQQNIA